MPEPLIAPTKTRDSSEALSLRARASGRSLSFVIPAFNEDARLPRTLEEIHGFLLERNHDGEILVVDDGSHDGTSEAVGHLQSTLPLLRTIRHLDHHRGPRPLLAQV